MAERSFFDTLERCTAAWQFQPDPVPEQALERMLRAATQGPSGGNLQPWRFVIVRDAERKRRVGEIYRRAWERYEAATRRLARGILGAQGEWALRTGGHLARTMGEVPVQIVVGAVNWSPALRRSDPYLRRLDRPDAIYASVFPALQNLMLAASAQGLATRLTTLHRIFEDELRSLLEIPEGVETLALIPVGYSARNPQRRHRYPLKRVVFSETWGRRQQPAREPDPLALHSGGA